MAKKDIKMLSLQKLASIPPVLPVISDHPLDKETAGQDKFDLCYRLGPIFDIIRHPKTAMPTTIAIYGDWGVGKTSAMKWLDALIGEWNTSKENADKTNVHTVWFYPWKYHDKEDVWRGLISEVILASINVKGADLPRVEKAAKQFGLFLGRSFLHVLGAVNEKAGTAVQKTIEEFNRVNRPEKAYLNEFESSLKEWTDETLSKNDRMVIFIDDLDRCMPEIALQVLEALKLYLNINKLIFVVGVDNNVIEPLVKAHYKELGLDDTVTSDKYLAKMFQTEVAIGPSEKQVTDYLDEQLEQIEYFSNKYLAGDEKSLFKELIEKFADRNPREVKRLINSAVMAGAGAEMLKRTGEKPSMAFKQGLQVFFIRKIVENPKTYNMPRLVGSNLGNEFFSKWSKIVCENRIFLPSHISFSEDYIQKLQQSGESDLVEKPTGVPEPYYELIPDFHFRKLLRLLTDENLGQLMQIEFSSEIAEITQKVELQPTKISDEEMIRVAIAEDLKKKPEEICPEDYNLVKKIELNNIGITNFNFLQNMTNLKALNLQGNKITDLTAFKDQTKLTELDLTANEITDLDPLKDLKNLTTLSGWLNQIDDITPLKNLKNLTNLNLHGNRITDISILKDLTNMIYLSIGGNQISDIGPLRDLKNLMELHLGGNQITDISPIKSLTNLTQLNLWNNPIIDISPIKGLTKLTTLGIQSIPITDLTALYGLDKLEYINIKGCRKITKDQVNELKKALPKLKIER